MYLCTYIRFIVCLWMLTKYFCYTEERKLLQTDINIHILSKEMDGNIYLYCSTMCYEF